MGTDCDLRSQPEPTFDELRRTRGRRRAIPDPTLAKTILDFHGSGDYTKPGPRLYPHQWSWDSALVAIGYARYDQDRTVKALNHLWESQ